MEKETKKKHHRYESTHLFQDETTASHEKSNQGGGGGGLPLFKNPMTQQEELLDITGCPYLREVLKIRNNKGLSIDEKIYHMEHRLKELQN